LSKCEETSMIKCFFIFIFLFGSAKAQQDFRLQWNFLTSHPQLEIEVCKFYVGNFVFYNNKTEVGREDGYFLMEKGKREDLVFHFSSNRGFDAFEFDLGVDSITHESGIMTGDLDPIQNMYWTWQAGYINSKIEGKWMGLPIQLHLGGFQYPFRADQKVCVHCTKEQYTYSFPSFLDGDFISRLNATQSSTGWHIMSPRKEAVDWMQWLATKMTAN
jgi:hypothetical protein